jgi:hypothetical protein
MNFRGALLSAITTLLLGLQPYAQEDQTIKGQDHSCTVSIGGGGVWPSGKDGNNFNSGWNLQAGGGFAVTKAVKPRHGAQLFITANYMYSRLDATTAALAAAISDNPVQLAKATAAHGSFSAVTVDPTARFPLNRRISVYGSGGFGWFRRSVGFSGANPANLIQPSSATLDRVASNSGAFDVGGGANIGLTKNGGLMFYVEGRLYQGAAINSTTRLFPISGGIRW